MTYLSEQLREPGLPIFVVVDGARVDNVDAVLEANELRGRPIFQGSDRGIVLAGPWIVIPDEGRTGLENALATAKACRGGVCWVGDCDEDRFVRHMRVLNVASMPDERIVWFRHYDPDVLAFLVPLFDAEQAAQVFGPARLFGFVGGRGDDATVGRPPGLPPAKTGPLKLQDWQIKEIDARQRAISRQKIADSLREAFPTEMAGARADHLIRDIERYDEAAAKVGLRSERGVFQWASLSILTGGRINRDDSFKRHLRSDGAENADRTLNASFETIRSQIVRAGAVTSRGVKE